MKVFTKVALSVALAGILISPTLTISASALSAVAKQPTGYTKAEDVDYVENSGKVANWGAKEEDCTFLSTYATKFYTGNYTYEKLFTVSGGTSASTAPKSELYTALQTLMKSKHTHVTKYDETKNLYKFTDCVRSDTTQLVSFYSGTMTQGHWGSGGDPWNREHTWPNSKGLNGDDENDIMMLRPTLKDENGSRGNKAYGLSNGYHVPEAHVRGDCARIVLYTYTRWGNTSKMWGTEGVIESLDILLQWMQEDPVDTWEMGRNDAVQSITGTRNVFVDYPEYAFALFGREIPKEMTTPSGYAKNPPAQEVESDSVSSSSESSEEEAIINCESSVYGVAGSLLLAFTCAFVLKKRKYSQK